jgi:hypothetical protein
VGALVRGGEPTKSPRPVHFRTQTPAWVHERGFTNVGSRTRRDRNTSFDRVLSVQISGTEIVVNARCAFRPAHGFGGRVVLIEGQLAASQSVAHHCAAGGFSDRRTAMTATSLSVGECHVNSRRPLKLSRLHHPLETIEVLLEGASEIAAEDGREEAQRPAESERPSPIDTSSARHRAE